ncbi:MAG: hypothetical protein KDK55_05820 [Chlamydiia bacterium]|nr:hypothetical protein [Chlamydiia bacterium]
MSIQQDPSNYNQISQAIISGFQEHHRIGYDRSSKKFLIITDKKNTKPIDTKLSTVSDKVQAYARTNGVDFQQINDMTQAIQSRATTLAKRRKKANCGLMGIVRRWTGAIKKLDTQLNLLNELALSLIHF